MCNKTRLACLMAIAGASLSSAALAQKADPVSGIAQVPDISSRASGNAGIIDDMAALELANKLGLNNPQPGLRGLPGCDIVNDGFNCHPAVLGEGANFSNAGPTNFRTMDNVTPATTNPTQICWIGRYANRVAPAVANEQFEVRIFNDIGGFPDLDSGPVFQRVFSQNGTAGVDQLTFSCLDGENCPGTTQPAAGGHYVYSADVTAGFPMNGNGCYWIEVTCVGSAGAGVNWGWVASTGGSDLFSLQAVNGEYTLFTRAANDRAICVSGGVNPGLGNCVIAPQPPVCENDEANGIPGDGVTGTIFRSSLPGSNGGAVWTAFQMAENFKFGSPATVSNICVNGYWGLNPVVGQPIPVAPEVPMDPGLVVTYFQNAGNLGVPGAEVPMATFAMGDPGVTYVDNGTPGDYWVSIDHPPVNFQANECYWVSVSRVNFFGQPEWFWYATTGAPPAAENRVAYRTTAPVGGWGALSGDPVYNLPFLLDAGPVIAPGTCLTVPACQITVPPGAIAEGENNCNGLCEGCDTFNGGCNANPPIFGQINCGDTVHGTVAVGGGFRDLDWYQFTITEPQIVTLEVNAEFVGFAGFAGTGGVPFPNFACEAGTVSPFTDVGLCEASTVTIQLEPATYTVIVAPDFAVDIPCGNNTGSEYTLKVTCEDVPGVPANDLCVAAIELDTPCTGNDVSVNGTTWSSTPDGMLQCGTATDQTAGGVWYRVVGNGSAITASTCSSIPGYDGQISVFTGTCGNMTCVDGNDDGCGSVGGMSEISWNSVEGTTYHILVHGWDVSQGDFSLVLSSNGACEGGCPADWDNSGNVNSNDISAFLSAWLSSIQNSNLIADFNGDNAVNSNDISSFLSAWLQDIQGGC